VSRLFDPVCLAQVRIPPQFKDGRQPVPERPGLALFSCPFFCFPIAYKFGVLGFETRARAFANFGN